jgi:hypothetical protein
MFRGSTDVNERVREQGLAQLECDVPDEMSLADWGRERRAAVEPERGWRSLMRVPRRRLPAAASGRESAL